MFIETVPNRDSPPAVLLRESYRDEQGRAQKRTLANLSKLPRDVIDGLKALLKGGTVIGTGPGELEIERRLKTPVLLKYENTPLSEVVDGLSQLTGVNIHLDPRGLTQEGLNSDTPVTINLTKEVQLKSALT